MHTDSVDRNDTNALPSRLYTFVRNQWVELETVLHPSRKRLLLLGLFTLLGHPVFWWLWTEVLPQAYESLHARALLALSGLVFFLQPRDQDHPGSWMRAYYGWNCWAQLPVFFIWMYWMNGASAMWMATVAVMIVVYFHLTDWRLASLGLLTGAVVATTLAQAMQEQDLAANAVHGVVFLFAWGAAFLLAISSASLRRERLQHSLTVMGIMAHELRTPIATISLIAQALRSAPTRQERVESLSERLDELTRMIHHHIDSQMMNARLMSLPRSLEPISAAQLVRQTLQDYPFNGTRDRQCIEIVEYQDFWFEGSQRQFAQVLSNLIKNALHSLKRAQSHLNKGDLRIIIGTRGPLGRIEVADKGVGIDEQALPHIFEPFFSTASDTGHGLGLAYCKQVVLQARGRLLVHSKPALGATFSLELPCLTVPGLSPAPSAAR